MIWWIVLLFVAGIILILAEFILPGAICGILGVVAVIASATLGAKTYPDQAFLIILGEIAAAVLALVVGMVLITRTAGLTGLTLREAQDADEGYVNVVTDTTLVGARGVSITPLRPSGTIEVNGNRLDAVTDNVFLELGTPIRVVEVHGNRIVVESMECDSESA